jgi:hypothetical protein
MHSVTLTLTLTAAFGRRNEKGEDDHGIFEPVRQKRLAP